MELGFGSSLLVRFQAGRCPEIDNVVTAALLPHQPDELRRRRDRYDNGERATPLYRTGDAMEPQNSSMISRARVHARARKAASVRSLANSQVALEAANEWFRNTALSRLNDQSKSLVVVTQQRLHTDDLSGALIERGWSSLVIPAIATEAQDYALSDGEVYHRPAGELLQADRDRPEVIEEIKLSVGSRIFASQYQQNPTPPEGNMIKAAWLRRYDSIPPRKKFRSMILSCDPAGKTGIKNDYTAMTLVGVDAKEMYLLHVERGHWSVLEMQNRITARASQWEATHIIIEDTASGMGLIQLLKEQTQLPVIGQHSTDDKETRLSRHEGRFEAGRILLPTEAPWLADFENELLAFPSGRYDDQVDALMLCLDWFSKNQHRLPPSSWPAPILFRIPRPGPF